MTMRKAILAAFLVTVSTSVMAQNFDDVTEKVTKGKYDEAKEKLSKYDADPKATAKSDYWFLKAKIYGNLGKASGDSAMLAQSFDAVKKYYSMEAGVKEDNKRMLRAVFENHQIAFDSYTNFAAAGVKSFQAKNWANAYYNFTQSLEAFDLLTKNKLTNATFDTTITVYAGFSAQNAGMQNNAVKYYGKLADARIADTAYADVYDYLVSYYMKNKDSANFAKYLGIGKEVFPKRDSWISFEMENLGTDKLQRLNRMEELMKANPTNFNLTLDYAVEMFNYTYGQEKPADYTTRLGLLTTALQNAIALNPTSGYANFIMTQHLSNQIYDLQQSYNAVKGTKPEDIKKKGEINKSITAKYDELLPYANTAYTAYENVEDIKAAEKANWRNVTNLLIDYYTLKKNPERIKFYEDKIKTFK